MSVGVMKLGDIANLSTGKLDSNAATEGGAYPFFTCDPTTLAIDNYAFDTEAVLLAGNNASGNFTAKYFKGKFNAYQRTYVITTKDRDVLLTSYLHYALNMSLLSLKSQSAGSTTKYLTKTILNSLPIPVPSIDSQQRIVEILSSFDNLIENNRRQIALLEEAAQRLYKEWFVDLRFPGYETRIMDGRIPEGWTHTTMKHICEAIGGGTPSTKNASYWDNGDIPWVTPSDVTGNLGLYLPKTEKQITREGLSHCSAKMLPAGTILMTSRASIGYFAICEQDVCTNQGFISCKPFETYYTWWLLLELKSRVEEMKSVSKGSTFLELGKTTFRGLPVIVPDKETLSRFQGYVQVIYNQMAVLRKQHDAALQARDRLLPKLMSGEIGV